MHLVRSWINENTGKIKNRKINTEELEGVHSDVIQMYKIRKHLRLKNKSTTNEARLVYWRMNSNLNLDTEWSFHPQPLYAVQAHEPLGSPAYNATGNKSILLARLQEKTAV